MEACRKPLHTALFAILFSLAAVLPLSGAELAPTACFDHYKYGTEAFSDFAPEKAEYAAGDAVNVRFKITNNFEIPLVDGNVKAVVVYKGEKDASNQLGDEIVDEFFMDQPVNLQPGAAMGGKITWTSPVGLRPGVYAINAYLMQTGKFNLKGLAFSTWSPGATTTFSMAGSGSPAYFDKAGITVNDGAYSERDIAPFFPPGEKVAISAPLKGTADSVTAELFAWDDSLETNRISVKEVSGNPAVLELAGLAEGVYLARFTAQTGDAKSVQWVRFAVEGKQGKIVHMGISSFPSQGQTTLHICLSNAPARSPGGASFIGNGEVVITDMDNNVLAAESFAGIDITPEPVGLAAAVSLPGQTKFRIAAVLKDSAGKVHDVAELDYDLSRFAGLERELSVVVPPTVSPGGPLAYTIAYFDGAGNPLAAKFYVTLEDASGQVVRLSEADVSGTAEQTLDIAGLANGQYTLKAVDGASSLADSVAFEVGDQPQAGQDAGWLLPIVAVAIIAAMALYILRRRQGL